MKQIRIAARAIIVNDNKLLCSKLTDYRYSNAEGFWCVPGGGVEDDEAIEAALNREIIEELGVKPVIDRLLFVQQYKIHDLEQIEFFFLIKNSADYLNIDLSKTSHGLEEIKELGFINPSEHYLLPEFLKNVSLNFGDQIAGVEFFNYL